MGGRVVEGTGLENRQGRKSFVGSNPTPSANLIPARTRKSPRYRATLNLAEALFVAANSLIAAHVRLPRGA
jgi:hypothetical protein